ncbi:Spermidine hydroxycinnamoyl transferase [Zea mays]|uniref:Spermidine hydroxycinnamoyl transferase n=1 Tax=Zea mays TaxID=4577 RepID=A0A1D6KCW0_MAIZE|nr:Spermidine hydroxycinnamoyl transferase [Zea mays]
MSSFYRPGPRPCAAPRQPIYRRPSPTARPIAVPRNPPVPRFDHRNIEFRGEHSSSRPYAVLPWTGSRTSASTSRSSSSPTSRPAWRPVHHVQCLLAHVWKKVTAARDLAPEEFTQIRVAVNCRAAPTLRCPWILRNMVLWAFPRMQARSCCPPATPRWSAPSATPVARVDADTSSPSSTSGHGGTRRRGAGVHAAGPGTAFCPDLEVDSWLGFRFHDLDFGYGAPCAFLPPDLPVEGLMILVPSCAAKGGVDLFMALDDDHVDAFKHICYSMD